MTPGIEEAEIERIKKENKQATRRIRILFRGWMEMEQCEQEIIAQWRLRGTKSSPNTSQQ
jgi:hypothetical protein